MSCVWAGFWFRGSTSLLYPVWTVTVLILLIGAILNILSFGPLNLRTRLKSISKMIGERGVGPCPFYDKCINQDSETNEAKEMAKEIDLLDIRGVVDLENPATH